jgi:hypothetical protein
MSTLEPQDCPLCRSPAEFFFTDSKNRKHFRCATCVEFEISRTMESKLTDLQGAALSKLAQKSTDKGVLVITSSFGRADLTNPQSDYVAEFVPRTELPR